MKKNQPPPLPQPTLTFKQVYQTIVNPTIDSFTLANEAIDKIVERGTKILYNTYLWTKMPQHLSNFVVTAYSELAQQEVMPYDPGESIDYLICNWNDDEEPEGTPLDSWSVYTAKVTKARAPTPTTMNNDSFTSVNDHRNSIFGKARSSLRKLTALSSARKSPAKQLDHVSEQVDLLKQEYELKFEKEPSVVIEEDKVVDQIREDIALRKKIKQKKLEEEEEIKRKKEELNQKIKAFERQSKDNAYTFDYEGNVLYVTKQENPKKKAVSNYNLQNPLATLKRLPTEAPVREIEEKEGDLKALSLLSTKQLTQEKYGMSKTAQFRDIIKMKPGAMLKMPNGVRQGPDFKEPERMRRDDFMKILESRKTDRGKQRDLKKIEEEEDSEDQKRKAESALASQLRKLAELNHMSEIEIHQHDILAQMIMNNTDPRHVEEMWNNRAKSKIEKEVEGEPVRKSILEDRIVEYNRTGFSEIKKQEPRPTTTKAQLKVHVSKIQQGLDNYNRNLLQKETWGQEKPRLSQIALTPIATPRLSPEKKLTLKASLFESHALKEPRERTTVGQKRALAQTARGDIESDKVVLPLIDIRSARAGDVEDKKFLLRSSSGKEKLPDNFEMKLKKQDLKQSGAKGNDDPYLIKNKSSLSVAVSLSKSSHTPRPRVNV